MVYPLDSTSFKLKDADCVHVFVHVFTYWFAVCNYAHCTVLLVHVLFLLVLGLFEDLLEERLIAG